MRLLFFCILFCSVLWGQSSSVDDAEILAEIEKLKKTVHEYIDKYAIPKQELVWVGLLRDKAMGEKDYTAAANLYSFVINIIENQYPNNIPKDKLIRDNFATIEKYHKYLEKRKVKMDIELQLLQGVKQLLEQEKYENVVCGSRSIVDMMKSKKEDWREYYTIRKKYEELADEKKPYDDEAFAELEKTIKVWEGKETRNLYQLTKLYEQGVSLFTEKPLVAKPSSKVAKQQREKNNFYKNKLLRFSVQKPPYSDWSFNRKDEHKQFILKLEHKNQYAGMDIRVVHDVHLGTKQFVEHVRSDLPTHVKNYREVKQGKTTVGGKTAYLDIFLGELKDEGVQGELYMKAYIVRHSNYFYMITQWMPKSKRKKYEKLLQGCLKSIRFF